MRRDGAWGLEALGQGAPAADVVGVADAIRARADELVAIAVSMRADAERLDGRKMPSYGPNGLFLALYSYTFGQDLRTPSGVSYAGAMNAQLLHTAAEQVNARSKGRMKIYNQRLPEDHPERLKRQAAKVRMSPADFLRALIELHTEALE